MTGGDCAVPHDGEGWCEACGLRLDDARPGAASCPSCGTTNDDGSYCEGCGRALPRPASPTTCRPEGPGWSALVSADRGLFEAVGGAARGFEFPDLAVRRIVLTTARVVIGRSDGPGPRPEVDLDGPPPDPGVSRTHAELSRRDDGGWAVRDCGSRNGTWVGTLRLARGEVVRVTRGTRIRLGLWSRVTLVRDDPGPDPSYSSSSSGGSDNRSSSLSTP